MKCNTVASCGGCCGAGRAQLLRGTTQPKVWPAKSCGSGRHWQLRRTASQPARALFGDLLQRLGPGSTNWPLWQPATEPSQTGRKAKLVGEELRHMRRLLEGCRLEKALRLPSPEEVAAAAPWLSASASMEQQEALVAAALHADPGCAASNAVPFSSGAMSGGSSSGSSSSSTGGSPGSGSVAGSTANLGSYEPAVTEPAKDFYPILPCLFAAEGRLDNRGAEFLASQLALSQLQLLDFARIKDGQAKCLPDSAVWRGTTPFPSTRVAAAAILRRMVARRGGLLGDLPDVGGSIIVLVFSPQDHVLAAESFALYLFLYCGFDLEQAAKEARLSMGAPVQPESLLPCLAELAAAVAGWQRRVKLVWPYGGGRVELSGDAVGGWDRKVPLAFDVRKRQWVLWLWGLPPGVYRCKFIVDGRWCVDMAAPSEYDGRGNVNNLVAVPEGPASTPPASVGWPQQPQQQPSQREQPAVIGNSSGGSSSSSAAQLSGEEAEVPGQGSGLGCFGFGEARVALSEGRGAVASRAADPLADGLAQPAPALVGSAAASLQSVSGDQGDASRSSSESDDDGVNEGQQQQQQQRDVNLCAGQLGEREGDVVRFGAMLLAFYTKLLQRRVTTAHPN